jgi:hypothetical protein
MRHVAGIIHPPVHDVITLEIEHYGRFLQWSKRSMSLKHNKMKCYTLNTAGPCSGRAV